MEGLKRRIRRSGWLCCVLALSFLAAYSVAAQTTEPTETETDAITTVRSGLASSAAEGGFAQGQVSLETLIGNIISVLLGLSGLLILAYLVWGGYIYATAQDDGKKTTKAKDMIKNAIIGTVIVIAAYAIASFVLSALTKITS